MIDVITAKFFLLHFKMAESFEKQDNILRDWLNIKYKNINTKFNILLCLEFNNFNKQGICYINLLKKFNFFQS